MRALPQLVCYAVSLLCALVIGGAFADVFWQVGVHARHNTFNGKPLPALTEALSENPSIALYLLLFPWLALLGLRLSTKAEARRFFDQQRFAVWYLAFLTVEFFLMLVMSVAAAAPFYNRYKGMKGADSAAETYVGISFWWLCLLVAVAGACRILQSLKLPSRNRRSTNALDTLPT